MTYDELDRLQERHVAFNAAMREAGNVVVAGPFLEQPNPSWRGMTIYRTSLEETRRLAHLDPSVQAGRLEVDIFTWLMPAGLLGDRPAYQVEE